MQRNIFLLLLLLASRVPAQKSQQIVIAENADVRVELRCRDTASMAQDDWIKVVIRNQATLPVTINAAYYSFNAATGYAGASQRWEKGAFGEANKYDLLDYYHDRDYRENPTLAPGETLESWRYVTSVAAARLDPLAQQYLRQITFPDRQIHFSEDSTYRPHRQQCAQLAFGLTYVLGGATRQLEQPGADFCFTWRASDDLPESALADRLRRLLRDPHQRSVNLYAINRLLYYPDVTALLSTDEFVRALCDRDKGNDGSIAVLLLGELKNRGALPDPRLTELYRTCIARPGCSWREDLMFYWDNALLDDVLRSGELTWWKLNLLELHAGRWSADTAARARVYDHLQQELGVSVQSQPTQATFSDWAKNVKRLAISRDRRVIDYLLPLLDQEAAFRYADWSRYAYAGMVPRNAQPDTIDIRVCDVAYVALLRALDQTYYSVAPTIGTPQATFKYKTDFVSGFEPGAWRFMKDADPDMTLAEKYLHLTPEIRERLRVYAKL